LLFFGSPRACAPIPASACRSMPALPPGPRPAKEGAGSQVGERGRRLTSG
jgi:hypothetical protein